MHLYVGHNGDDDEGDAMIKDRTNADEGGGA
jgi:hypothetical protein